MPSKSKAQQRFFGVVKGIQKGGAGSGKAKKAADDMDPKDVDDFASTKHKGLPNRVKKETKVRKLIRKMVREIMSELDEGGPGSGPQGEDNPFDREPSDDELADIEKDLDEAAKRDYKAEYKKFQSSTKAKKYRAELNKYNRQKGTYGNGDKKDASHKGGKIVGFEEQSKNRGRAEKSRLKKEEKLSEDYKNSKWEVYVGDDAYGKNRKVVKVAKSKRAATILYNKLIKTDKYFEVGMRVVKEGITLSEKCWKGYEKKGMKTMFGKRYPNCVKKETIDKLNEKLSKMDIKKMRDKFNKTGKLPPHLMKLAKLMDKHTEVRNIVVPGLEWMSKLGEGKLNEVKNPLWDKSNAQSALNQIKKGLKNAVPYVDDLDLGAVSRRDDYPSFVGKISVDNKKDWPNGYIHNSRFALVHIDADGTIDTVRMNGYRMGKDANGKKVPILRKSKNRTIKQIIDRLGRYFTVIRTKHPGSD